MCLFESELTRVALHVLYGELQLVLRGDVLPGGEEDLLLHGPVLGEEDVGGHGGGEVEHVDVVLDGHLQGRQRVHPLHRAVGAQGEGHVHGLRGWEK